MRNTFSSTNSISIFLMKQLVASDLDSSESKEVMINAALLFRKINSKGIEFRPEHWSALFNYISNEKYNESIVLTKVILSFLKREEKLQNNNKNLKKKFNQEKQQFAVLQTFKGWIKYKSKNIWIRFKRKLMYS